MFSRRQGERFNRGRIATKGAVATYDPAVLSLTFWWRGSYSASPWAGTASAGGSGARDASEGTNAPAAGTAVNGFTPAAGDGSNDLLSHPGTAIGTLLPTAGYMYWILFYPDAIGAGSTNAITDAFSNEGLLMDSGGYVGASMFKTGNKVQAWHYDTTGKGNEHAVNVGAWNLLFVRYTGTAIRSQLNGGSFSSTAAGAYDDATATTTRLLTNYNASAFSNARILDIGGGADTGTDQTGTDILTYVRSRYPATGL